MHLIYNIYLYMLTHMGFPGGSGGKESASNAGDHGSVLEPGRSPERNGYLLHYFHLQNSPAKELGRLQSMGLQRDGHEQKTNTFTFSLYIHTCTIYVSYKYVCVCIYIYPTCNFTLLRIF